jgi:hypothetical protein
VGYFVAQAYLADEPRVEAMYEQVVRSYGRLDVIYNNVGLMDPGDRSALGTSLQTWHRVQDGTCPASVLASPVRRLTILAGRAWAGVGDEHHCVHRRPQHPAQRAGSDAAGRFPALLCLPVAGSPAPRSSALNRAATPRSRASS